MAFLQCSKQLTVDFALGLAGGIGIGVGGPEI